MSTAPVCSICHKPYYDDGSFTAVPELCQGHESFSEGGWMPTFVARTGQLPAIEQPDYSLVLERIAIALEDIVTKLGYLSGVY